ncbi:putative membrane protein YdjX (TVP38/TMEM64 family) [Pontibacter aydingkolensis]|uniref:TVP38/TMEM64 family membrane protein n=1 Tax=Pontibacter aydingkolensis TaxID=1911536 RepID=A0ABS7CPV5_9BACT|nr:VTT domain-containing protein [Pontibacter aydingkolensis]MBW7465582.1 VTT domain-containing protein [Pontibacter aydingkolensis]
MKLFPVLRNLIRENASTFISMLLLVVVPVVVSSTLAFILYQYQDFLRELTWLEMLVFFAVISVTMAFALTPTTFVALVSGFYLGWNGFAGIVVSYGIAALVGYGLAQLIDHGKMMSFLNRFEKARILMQELRNQSWSLIFLTRISPVLPFALMNFVLSLLQVNKKKFLVASIIGMLPRTLFFFWIGTQANDIINLLQDPDSGTGGQLLMISLIVISIGGLYFVFDRALKKALRKATVKND